MASICDTCHAGCCRAYHLFITVYDALRISTDLGIPIGEFATMVSRSEEEAKKVGKGLRPLRFSDPEFKDAYFYLALKRVESRLVPGTLRCYFLQEWERTTPLPTATDHPGSRIAGRCGIYTSRPLMCRTFPTFLHSNGKVAFINNPEPVRREGADPIYTLCPEEWTPGHFSTDSAEVLHNLVLRQYENEFQNGLIDEWNAAPGTLKDFFPHAIRCYQNRFRPVPKTVQSADAAPIPE